MSYRVRLEMFEGPLDLLLYLIQVNEIDIYDIPIAKITEEYLECLARMHELDLEVAGEFLVIAASLILMKSKMLLPKMDAEEEELPQEDPRKELVERLLEYKRFKEAAMTLEELESRQHMLYGRPPDSEALVAEGPLEVSLSELLRAFAVVMQRATNIEALEITPEAINMGERMVALLDRLKQESPLPFSALFEMSWTRTLLIVTFLALLELLHRGLVRARQTEPHGQITLYRAMETQEEGNGRPA